MNKTVCILVVDDRPLFREYLVAALSRHTLFHVIGVELDNTKMVEALKASPIFLALIDTTGARSDPIEMIGWIRQGFPETKVIVAVKEAEPAVLRYIESGAVGYALSDASLDDLVDTLQMALRGETLCSSRLAFSAFARLAELAPAAAGRTPASRLPFTPRQMQIFELMAEGLSNKEIAQQTCLSLYTVKNYIGLILKHFGMKNRIEVVRYALSERLIGRRGELASEAGSWYFSSSNLIL
jgi:DNA-binding NarL/FixJ family response regulator